MVFICTHAIYHWTESTNGFDDPIITFSRPTLRNYISEFISSLLECHGPEFAAKCRWGAQVRWSWRAQKNIDHHWKNVFTTNHTTVILKVRSWIFDGEFFTLLSQIQFHHPLFSFITIIQYWSCTETCCDGLLKQIVLYACTINSSSNHGGNPRVVLVSVQGPRPQVMRMGLGMQVIAYSCSPHSSMCIVVTYVSMPS